MDEPLSNLDAQLRQDMRREIRDLQRRLGLTLIYVTHDQTEAMSMADQVILMRAGGVEQAGPPETLYARPETVFAARFIGASPMNLLALEDRDGGGAIAGTAGPAAVRGAGAGRILGLRPEDVAAAAEVQVEAEVRAGAEVQAGADPGVAATLVSCEFQGADSLLTCRAGAERVTARRPGLVRLQPGTPLRLSWPAEAVHLFDAGTGRRCPDRACPTGGPPDRRDPAMTPFSPTRLPSAALLLAALLAALAPPARAGEKVQLSFFYPVAIGGPVTKIVDDLVAGFETENPDVEVKAVYAGTYQETIGKALTARKGGQSPDVAVLLSADMYTMIDQDAVLPIDGFARTDADKGWLGGFFPAFMRNSRTAEHTWGIPFQRSTTVLYWNKDAFKAAGLDPEKASPDLGRARRRRPQAHGGRTAPAR